MPTVGIVCEYNPFHKGHLHMIEEIRRRLGEDVTTACVMSGDYVQRGESACFDKFVRAEAACRCGADLVLELPLPWCMAPAETFARGAVGLLGATGIVTRLCFGSESGDLPMLRSTARILLRPETDERIRRELETGCAYAAARQRALEAMGGAGAALTQPNDILAVEYLKALELQALPLEPFAVARRGARHDAPDEDA